MRTRSNPLGPLGIAFCIGALLGTLRAYYGHDLSHGLRRRLT